MLTPILWVVFIGTLGFSLVLPFLVFLVIDLGGNAFVYGIVGATYASFQLVGAPVLGRLSDRVGRRRVLLVSQFGTFAAWALFLIALALPVTSLVNVDAPLIGRFTLTVPLVLVFVARALDGLTGGNVSVANAYVADVTADEDRSASFGRLAVAQNLGFVVGPAVAGLLGATVLGAALPVVAALLVSGAAIIVIARRLPESQPCLYVDAPRPTTVGKVLGQEQRDCHEVQGARRLGLGEILRLPGIGLLLAVHFIIYLAFNLFYIAFPVHAATGLAWSTRGVGLFLSLLSGLMVLVQGPVLGALARRASDRTLVLTGGMILAVSFLIFTSESVWVLGGGAALLASATGSCGPRCSRYCPRLPAMRRRGASRASRAARRPSLASSVCWSGVCSTAAWEPRSSCGRPGS